MSLSQLDAWPGRRAHPRGHLPSGSETISVCSRVTTGWHKPVLERTAPRKKRATPSLQSPAGFIPPGGVTALEHPLLVSRALRS